MAVFSIDGLIGGITSGTVAVAEMGEDERPF
jgi:hypothetical protein